MRLIGEVMKILTPYGNVRTVNALGHINGSDQWIMLGIEHVKRNEFIPFSEIEARLPHLTLLYKNGNPQYTVRDRDHGTVRTWGNTKCHGIKSISLA